MPTLSPTRIAELLKPYSAEVDDNLAAQLGLYLDLLIKWNARTNLTAIRDPEQIVTRHFGESLFLAGHIPADAKTLLDLGSGAGFPGLPAQLLKPQVHVTLAESQNKKAAFLREAVRVLGLKTEVWSARVEELPVGRLFDVVALRAVDHPQKALELAGQRLARTGTLLHLAGGPAEPGSISVPCSATRLRVSLAS